MVGVPRTLPNYLLVRVLQADGLVRGPELVEVYLDKSKTKGAPNATQVRIGAQTVAPNFKVLLYPFKKGAPLPKTQLRGDQLSIEWDDQKDSFRLVPDKTKRTQIIKK